MTAYAFDLDGVLDKPAMRQLSNDLFDAGHEVYVVTGGLADTGKWTMEARRTHLARLGIRYTELWRCIAPTFIAIGLLKGGTCNEIGAAILFDDSAEYLRAVAEVSQVQRVLVL